MERCINVIGGGLAGCEAAWQAAENGIKVFLFEMRPKMMTGAHKTGDLAELVCSNSLGSKLPDRALGILHNELVMLGSLLVDCANQTKVPAGDALAVDRILFSQMVTQQIEQHPNIEVIREEVCKIPDGHVIIASGPLTSERLSREIKALIGESHLYFYDAIAPLIEFDSINMEIAFWGSRRHDREIELGDYINCPFTENEYNEFVDALSQAERFELKDFEDEIDEGVKAGKDKYFEGCLPVEVLAKRGHKTLAYGPMRPIGLIDPRTNKRPFAVVQLRKDNLPGSIYNLVGFQTNMKISEQDRVLRMIPGLESVKFLRYGQMHRNTYIYSPGHVNSSLQYIKEPRMSFAGQIIGVEGYMGNIGTGLLAGLNMARSIIGKKLIVLPEKTILGALCKYISDPSSGRGGFQPMKANLGLLPPLEGEKIKSRKERGIKQFERSEREIKKLIENEIN